MHTIQVNIKHAHYPIHISEGILENFAQILQSHRPVKQIAIVTSENIDRLYGENLRKALPPEADIVTLFVPDGEKAKSIEQLQKLYTELLQKRFERSALLIAFGGGVVGDLAGFIAATFLRGIDLVQAPTTLLAQVDSSIGGKVGINHALGKNLIGAFKQPLFVLSDTSTLQTLADEEIRCGLGEVIKYGFILNIELFKYLEENIGKALQKEPGVLEHLVCVSAAEKARVVEQDERENNLRMILNYGHTFGHALEAEMRFSGIKHGEAVILGMQCALHYQYLTKTLSENEYQRGMALLKRVPVSYDKTQLDINRLVDRMTLDKKVKDKKIRLILLEKIGRYRIDTVNNRDLLKKAFMILI
ncbi:MAG TPA: 3-dehydroquinate synthase [Calditrichaeota bacterium]|nr:3-dehydroquinate synthase [Calditrichota bacterium]